MARHSYGYIPDKKDERDFTFKSVQQAYQLPVSIDLRPYCSKVRDQGNLGACTGFAIATGLREYMQRKSLPATSWIQKLLFHLYTLSPLFLYYEERVLEGTIDYDSGAEIRDGMKVLKSIGVCREYKDPYIISRFTYPPSKQAMQNAGKYKIIVYSRLTTLTEIKSALAAQQGVVFGFDVYESFESEEVAETGNVPMPQQGEQLLGGHAVFCCGYKDDPNWAGGGYLIIKNSWGIGWGDNGYCYMPYAYMDYMADIWTATM